MQKALIAAALLSASLFSCAYAQGVVFKGVPLGSPKEELQTKFPSIKCSKPMRTAAVLGEEHCTSDVWQAGKDGPGNPLYSYGGQPATDAAFGVVAGKVESFSMKFQPHSYEAIRNALREAYGKGDEDQRTMQTARGASFVSRIWSASIGLDSITLLEHSGSVDSGLVSGRTATYEAYQKRVRAGDSKAGAKDL